MASVIQKEEWQSKQQTAELDSNIVYEVLRRVDALTLAAASCVNRNFRSVAEEEDLWEKLCNDRWPATKDSEVKSVLLSVGGYRRMYAHCYPSIIDKEQSFRKDDHHDDELGNGNASDFISIVDVAYGSQSLLSRIVNGIPGAEDCQGWFSTCPFRTDLLALSGNEYRDHGGSCNMVVIDLPSVVSKLSGGLKNGSPLNGARVWKMLCDNITVSWILINRKTRLMANLASRKTLGGCRYWLCDEDFLMRFGSVFPASPAISDSTVGGGPVQCNISLVCSLNVGDHVEALPGETSKATLRLSELSLQLEDSEGALATGHESVEILQRALSCPRSLNCGLVADSYERYMKVRNEVKARNLKYDGRLNVAAALASGISSCLFIVWLFKY